MINKIPFETRHESNETVEIWKDIKNYEGYYQVSNLGNIKSLDRYVNNKIENTKSLKKGKQKIKTLNKNGYLKVTLFKNGKGSTREIQRFVAETFIENIEQKPQVNHINGIKTDNRLENLEWCTLSENMIHSIYVLGNNIKKVKKYDLNDNFIQEYISIKDAALKNNIKCCSISNAISERRKTAGGFIWKLN